MSDTGVGPSESKSVQSVWELWNQHFLHQEASSALLIWLGMRQRPAIEGGLLSLLVLAVWGGEAKRQIPIVLLYLLIFFNLTTFFSLENGIT